MYILDMDNLIDHPFTIPRPLSLRSHVENVLRDAITSGRFQPGERLRERELCEMLDVSRTSLREALRQLEAEKLISHKPNVGPTVATINLKEAQELYAVRALLESFAVHEFARNASDIQIDQLGAAVQKLHHEAESGDQKRLLTAKAEFYEVILDGCGNALVKDMLLGMLSRINLLRSKSFSQADRLRASLKEIDHLFELIRQRDAEAAQAASRQHIINAQQAALAVLGQPTT